MNYTKCNTILLIFSKAIDLKEESVGTEKVLYIIDINVDKLQ